MTTTSFPDPIQGQAYNLSLTASGGNVPYTWQLTSGELPPGLDLSTDGAVAGIPYPAGTYSGQISVTDSSSPATTVPSRSRSLSIHPSPPRRSPSPHRIRELLA